LDYPIVLTLRAKRQRVDHALFSDQDMLLEGSSGAQFIMRLQRLQAAQEHDIALRV
jgi:hypothetical protein